MQENPSTTSFMFFFIIIILLMVMDANGLFILIGGILTAIGVLIGVFWPYENKYLCRRWLPHEVNKMNPKLSHAEFMRLVKISEKKAIKAYNDAVGISKWKRLHKKKLLIVILTLSILACVFLADYYKDHPVNIW